MLPWLCASRRPAALALLLLSAWPCVAADLQEDEPRIYLVASSALEAHHDAHAASSGYAYLLHAGIDYGTFAIEGVMEGPLAKEQPHVRRSLGLDVLFHPCTFKYVEPYLCSGLGYYFPAAGADAYATWAANLGAGIRLPVSDYVFLQIGARCLLPFDTAANTFLPQDHFEIMEIGIGARY
jgi:hypothetical protein